VHGGINFGFGGQQRAGGRILYQVECGIKELFILLFWLRYCVGCILGNRRFSECGTQMTGLLAALGVFFNTKRNNNFTSKYGYFVDTSGLFLISR
jgi:hypothetical protein